MSNLHHPRGIWVPLVTPLRHGALDLARLQTLAESMIDQGVHGLVVCGTTGEAATLEPGEQNAVLAAVLEAADGRCPVLLGISGNDTYAAAGKVMQFEDAGVDGFLVCAPSYVKPSQQGMQRHFEVIADATSHPIVLYNVPSRTGVNLELATVQKLALRPQFVAIKEAGGNLQQMSDLVAQAPLAMLCGDDALLFAALCAGGHGAISAAAHLRPDLFVQLYDLIQAQQLMQARALFQLLLPMIRLLFTESNPAPLKAALAMRGLLREELRLPMTPVSDELRQRLAVALGGLMDIPSYRPRSAAAPQPMNVSTTMEAHV
jgi:4-hydroxy-tetrahydrodipicolinate synthase